MMEKSWQKLPGVYRLGDSNKQYLQVLLSEFTLKKSGRGKIMTVTIDNDDLCIRDSQTKYTLHHCIEKQNKEFEIKFVDQLDRFNQDEHLLAYHFDCSHFPIRHSNGGVLPVIRLDQQEYFCLFYRDFEPVGWNIANGGSGNIEELLYPQKVLFREFSEELIVVDNKTSHLYQFDSFEEGLEYGIEPEALELWSERLGYDYVNYRKLSIPIKWIEGPDELVINYHQNSYRSKGCFLSITSKDNAVELDKIALINLKDVTLLDGELTRTNTRKNKNFNIYNRIIGLFRVDKVLKNFSGHKFTPDIIYFNGQQHKPEVLNECIKMYLQEISDPPPKSAINAKFSMDLCPITRSIVKQYKNWVYNDIKRKSVPVEFTETEKQIANGKYKIFISYKSKDAQLAENLYEFLTFEKEIEQECVFYSRKSIMQLGESDYARLIDQALDKASCLIVLGSRPEFFNSGWVGYEWRSFLNEIRSERKKYGKVFTFTVNIPINNLPYGLRNVQNIAYNLSSPQDSFEKLYVYLKKNL